MPQLEISTFTSQLFWLCISFFTMLFIMSSFITPRISHILTKRKNLISDLLKDADDRSQKAQELLDSYYSNLAQATTQANISLEKTQKDMNELVSNKQLELANKLNAKIVESEAKINASSKKALSALEKTSDTLVNDVLKKIGLNIKIEG